MTYTVKYYPKAEIEYLDAYDWYQEQVDGLGDRFEFCIEKNINTICSNPFIYPTKN